MKKEIKEVDRERGIVRITTLDERWYAKPGLDKETGLPTYKFLPSSTWIASYYPKGIGFYKWLASKGWDEAEAIKISAGNRGSKVHQVCEDIERGAKIKINSQYMNSMGLLEELTSEEIECIIAFCDWLDNTRPQVLASEKIVFGNGYAGTLDRIYKIGGQVWIVDIKTSQEIWQEQIIQVSSYSHNAEISGLLPEEWAKRKLAILQLGYRRNKKGWKFTEIEDKFHLFQMAYAIWQNENPDAKPKQRDYPLILQSQWRKEVTNEETKTGKIEGKISEVVNPKITTGIPPKA